MGKIREETNQSYRLKTMKQTSNPDFLTEGKLLPEEFTLVGDTLIKKLLVRRGEADSKLKRNPLLSDDKQILTNYGISYNSRVRDLFEQETEVQATPNENDWVLINLTETQKEETL
ncbi:unnamed protein product [Moneuplotes crassus]|uniref:Uncharacterized protein n=1 Tax=Euplotes crassus TaxID=5936 RepID=A0AAD1XSX8_EUPCR|nr:unnamed protein product [Moneuplotes crassus]